MPDRLADEFLGFADQCHGSSPSYELLAGTVAGDTELLNAIKPAVGPRFNANLFFAAVRYLALGEHREVPVEPGDFRSFCFEQLSDITEILSTRVTQTNEVARCGYLLLGFEIIRRQAPHPLALFEVGASAGLNLLFDRYRYDYGRHGAVGPFSSPVILSPQVLSGEPPVPDRLPTVVWRLGIDLRPLNPGDSDDRRGLTAMVWPEHRDLERRLQLALELAATNPPEIRPGNAVDLLVDAASGAPPEATLVIFHTNTMGYFSAAERKQLTAGIAEVSASRPCVRLSAEGPKPGARFEGALKLVPNPAAPDRERVLAHTLQHARGFAWVDSD